MIGQHQIRKIIGGNVTGINQSFLQTFENLPNNGELSRLITAAVVNREFCSLLLTNPEQALKDGYKGEAFILNSAEQSLICSIEATSLADFANQLINCHGKNGYNGLHNGVNGSNGHSNGNGRNGSG